MLVQEMKKDLTSQTTIWNIIQGYTYYLLFLEQAVQVARRQMNDGILDSSPEIEEAFATINSVMENFQAIKINPKDFTKRRFIGANSGHRLSTIEAARND